MNESMPNWRVFSSDAEDRTDAAEVDGPSDAVSSGVIQPLVVALGSLAGLAAGAALAVGVITLLGWPSGTGVGAGPGSLAAGQLPNDAPGLVFNGGSFDGDDPLAATELGARGLGAEGLPTIVVDVAGAVRQPGLHRLHAGDRVGDAIAAAGGFAPRVDLAAADRSLNLAEPLRDGVKILVPELGAAGFPADAADVRIDLNAADQAALESLPGIGPVTAGKIIEARSQQRFASVEELLTRDIVGESVYEDIHDLVRASS